MYNLKPLNFCFILLLVVARGNTNCLSRDGKKLECEFPENINVTKKDFVVYFYPASGDGDEKLVDCAWLEEQLHCIKQDGFDCKQPVSTTADISIPTRFATRAGSYKCIADGYKPDDVDICNSPGRQDEKYLSICEINSEEKPLVNVTCKFSFRVENFTVKEKLTVVASYTKSSCLRSSKCRYYGDNDSDASVFTVMLEATSSEHDEYSCVPETSTSQLRVEACKSANNIQNETSSLTALAVILPLLCLAVLAVAILLLLRRKRGKANCANNYDKETPDENLETLIPDQLPINDEKRVDQDKPVTTFKSSSLISRATYLDCTVDDDIIIHSSNNGIDYTQELLRNDKKGQCTTQYSSNALILPQSVLTCRINNEKEKRCINVLAPKCPVMDIQHEGSKSGLNMQHDDGSNLANVSHSKKQKTTVHWEDIWCQTPCTCLHC